jgi:hypothetical protein
LEVTVSVSSANPDDLDRLVTAGRSLNETLRARVAELLALYESYRVSSPDVPFQAQDLLDGLVRYLAQNDEDDEWVHTVAAAFRRADHRHGGVATVSNASIAAALRTRGLS